MEVALFSIFQISEPSNYILAAILGEKLHSFTLILDPWAKCNEAVTCSLPCALHLMGSSTVGYRILYKVKIGGESTDKRGAKAT